jgi:hypothetical protein
MISAFEPTCRPHVHIVEDEEEEENDGGERGEDVG